MCKHHTVTICVALPTLSSAQKEYKHLAGRAEIDEPAMIWGAPGAPGAQLERCLNTEKQNCCTNCVWNLKAINFEFWNDF
jgi:hypothetical protein